LFRRRSLLLVSIAAAVLLAAPSVVLAQYGGEGSGQPAAEKKQEKKKEKKKRRWGKGDDDDKGKAWQHRHEIDPRTGKRLIEARELVSAEDYDGASKALGKLRLKSLNPLEKARVYQISAFISFGRGDLPGARANLEKTLAENILEPSEAADLRFQIAQLWMQEENWAETAKNLELWLTMEENPNPSSYYMLALTYYQLEDFDKALVPARQAVELSKEPRESWLQLVLAILLTRKDYEASVPVIEELVTRFPKKAYWLNLSTVQGVLGNYEEALVPLQLAYTQGLLTSDAELRRLAQLLLFLDLPYRSAKVMQQGLDEKQIESDSSAWEMLSNSWIAAREFDKAVAPLQRAADLAKGGDLYVRLAQVHIQREKWQEAAAALSQAIDKGGLDNPGDAQLLMGIAYYSQKRPERARTWFARARKHDATRQEADTWLRHIEREAQSG